MITTTNTDLVIQNEGLFACLLHFLLQRLCIPCDTIELFTFDQVSSEHWENWMLNSMNMESEIYTNTESEQKILWFKFSDICCISLSHVFYRPKKSFTSRISYETIAK